MTRLAKLTIVVAACLPPGLQATQAMHAARQFADEHPAVEQQWYRESNTLVLLSVADGNALEQLYDAARCAEIRCSAFHDPDIGEMPVTAVALEPSDDTRRLCRWLSLALKNAGTVANANRPANAAGTRLTVEEESVMSKK